MHKYLPSKRFAYIILSLILAFGIIYIFSLIIKKPTPTKIKFADAEVKVKIQEFMLVDTDGDSLKDWEETLYKTDPNKADTDADGTNDADELKVDRDPLKANTAKVGTAPNDKIDEQIIASIKKTEADFAQLTETEKVSRMVFSQFIATRKIDQPLTNTDIVNIIQNSLTQASNISFSQYKITDIKATPIVSPETLKAYGNNIGKVIIRDLLAEKIATQDPDIFGFSQIEYFINTLDTTAGTVMVAKIDSEFNPVIKKYQILINNLLNVSVPSNFAQSHLNLINAFELIRDNLSQIKNSSNNPILTLNLLKYYTASIENIIYILEDTGKIFTDNNIIFSPTDPGYEFISGII